MKELRNVSIVFVCQRGEIEVKSLLLAFSLRNAFGDSPEIFAVVPESDGYNFSPGNKSLELLETLNVTIKTIPNNYLMLYQRNLTGNLVSNKIHALKSEVSGEFLLLLDSDILCLNPEEWKYTFNDADLIAKQANRCEITQWERIYQLADLTVPPEKYHCTVDNRLAPLYLNSGVLLMKSAIKNVLFENWLDYFNLLSQPENLKKHLFDPFFRDQVALSLAIRKAGLRVILADEKLNYPMRVRILKSYQQPLFAHYHDVPTVMSHPITRSIVYDFINRFDALRVFMENETWRKWLKAGKIKMVFLRANYKIPRIVKPLLKRPLRRLKVIASRLLFETN